VKCCRIHLLLVSCALGSLRQGFEVAPLRSRIISFGSSPIAVAAGGAAGIAAAARERYDLLLHTRLVAMFRASVAMRKMSRPMLGRIPESEK